MMNKNVPMFSSNALLELTHVFPRKLLPVQSQRQNGLSVFIVNFERIFYLS